MDLYDWLLFLHLLSAFLVVGALTTLWALILGTRTATPDIDPDSARRFGRTGGILVGVGMMGTIVFGIWLAIDVDGYELWDGWIIAAFVLWMVAGALGGRLERGLRVGDDTVDARLLVALMALVTTLLLLDMIFKPGA